MTQEHPDFARRLLVEALQRRRAGSFGSQLQERYIRQYATPTRVSATTFVGEHMDVVLPELVACEIHAHGVIEPALSALFVEVAGPGRVIFDVGAHLGYYTLIGSSLGAAVHAFEPSRDTLSILESNVAHRALVVRAGLWRQETTLDLKDFGAAHSAINTFLSSKDETVSSPVDSYRVEVVTLDEYVMEAGVAPDLLKLDVEGAELAVLEGGTSTITSKRPLITVEVGDAGEATSRAAIEYAIELGYAPYELTETGLRPHVLRDRYTYGNVLLVSENEDPPRLGALELSS